MDSNVSKNTFCQKLLKLALIPDILAIGKVLKQHLTLTIKAYSSLHHPETEFALIESLLTDKLILWDSNRNSRHDQAWNRCPTRPAHCAKWNWPPPEKLARFE